MSENTQPGQTPEPPPPPMPPANWSPSPLAGGRPTMSRPSAPQPQLGRPLGDPTAPKVEIESYAPPRSRLPWLIVALAVVVIAAIWAATTMLAGSPSETGSPSPVASPSSSPSATVSGQRFASESGDLTGTWELVEHKWVSDGLDVRVRVSVDEGRLNATLMAFGYQQNEASQPSAESLQPAFTGYDIEAGEEASGWVHFDVPPGPCSIFLMDATIEEQMSALTVDY